MSQNSSSRARATLLILIACAMLATACGSTTTVLDGDIASASTRTEAVPAETATTEPVAAAPAPTEPPVVQDAAATDDSDGSQIVLAADPTPEPHFVAHRGCHAGYR